MISQQAMRWIRFIRQYGPIPRNDNMYDEHIRKSAKRAGIRPLAFVHPAEQDVLDLFRSERQDRRSVVLTGTAGDGKSHLCGKIWTLLGGSETQWYSDDVYHTLDIPTGGGMLTIHVIRDLTALPPHDAKGRYADKAELLTRFCDCLCEPDEKVQFLVAANDGQLVENLHRLPTTDNVARVRTIVETLLVDGRREGAEAPLTLFNLSRVPCAALFDLALDVFLEHEGWSECYASEVVDGFFGNRCPIRHNYELLKSPLVRGRLRLLFELCDCNELHVPIRRMLLLFANAILGHADAKDRLMQAGDVSMFLQKGTTAKASLFNNLFGGNLSEVRRDSLEVFDYLNRFRIGHETSNRVDNILIFGEADENLKPYFDALLRADSMYGADDSYYAAQRSYVEGDDADPANDVFLRLLISQRRGLFFKIQPEWEQELSLWELTVFKYAGEYLEKVLKPLGNGARVERPFLARLVKGLNRIFVGMLVNSDRDLLLATSISFSSSKVSQVLEDRIPVTPRLNERVELVLANGKPALHVQFSQAISASLPLNLTRYEFLSRVAEGALPGSFSRECYEDMLAFKSRLLTCLNERRRGEGGAESNTVAFHLLTLDPAGNPLDDVVEVTHG
ncbi:MAG: hypothetical protein IPM20_12550 [Gammaproteobacteria bacterium]|nr:hypothetical protein [Gammaproteobacteria bacterium]